MSLEFCESQYTVNKLELAGNTLVYRAFEQIPYVEHPRDEKLQCLSIYVPEEYYHGGSCNGYSLKNAPIFMPNTVGGYMTGPAEGPGKNSRGEINASFYALLHGYVVVSPGVRGRDLKNEEGKFIGRAPAAICDLKSAVRFLRKNKDKIPGDVEKIISNGTSAGGALSSLIGATGNHPDYEEALAEMGAARERDDIFAASCYCPITNLDHADMAYEWEFKGMRNCLGMRAQDGHTTLDKEMTDEQMKLSEELAALFPAYLNSLKLKDKQGQALTLDEEGKGSFRDYVLSFVAASAQKEADRGKDMSGLNWLTVKNGKVEAIDFHKYIQYRTRMKDTPAFDNVSMGTPENELFGTEDVFCRHFTEFSHAHSKVQGEIAELQQIKMMNPMYYINDDQAVKAKHYRIRHGCIDRDTSLAVPAMLTAALTGQGVDTDLAYPWGTPHSGDYDLEELFAWIDRICS